MKKYKTYFQMELKFFLENMLFCKSCKKEVILYGVSYKEGIDEELDQFRNKIEEEGKLILFNPPPFGPYNCPLCGTKLEEKFDSL